LPDATSVLQDEYLFANQVGVDNACAANVQSPLVAFRSLIDSPDNDNRYRSLSNATEVCATHVVSITRDIQREAVLAQLVDDRVRMQSMQTLLPIVCRACTVEARRKRSLSCGDHARTTLHPSAVFPTSGW
jgi:hypothetical protein